jgi:hypothetical protein
MIGLKNAYISSVEISEGKHYFESLGVCERIILERI